MGKVDCLSIHGLDLWFNSSDHLPPHIHVRKRGEWEIRVFFMACTTDRLDWSLKWRLKGSGPSSRERAELLGQVLKRRAELYAEWERKVSFTDPRED
ncbi:MAG: DUF4160 domain-containing protein [Dehalococcoidia bacterium]